MGLGLGVFWTKALGTGLDTRLEYESIMEYESKMEFEFVEKSFQS